MERTLEVQWDMQIHPHSPGVSLIERHETVKMTMVKTGANWDAEVASVP
jgi:hypothetical protein